MRRLTPLWIFIFIFAAGAVYLPGLSKYLKLKHREDELTSDINRLETQINALRQEEHLLRTDLAHLEEVVREELGLVKPGEMIYKIVEEEIPQAEETKEGEVKRSRSKTSN